MLSIALQGFAMGLAFVAPIGMQNLFVINSAISHGRARALCTSLMVTLFDVSLTLACFFGVGAVMDAVPGLSRIVQLVGGALVVGIGVALVLPKRKERPKAGRQKSPATGGGARESSALASPDPAPGLEAAAVPTSKGAGLGKTFLTAFVVTWCNPQALLDGTMMLGAFRATFPGGDGVLFVMGACAASIVWFQGIALAVNALGSRFSDRVLRIVNVVCGCVVVLYGLRLIAAFFGLGA